MELLLTSPSFILQLIVISFFLNFIYEVYHSELYTTCHKMTYVARINLLTIMSLKDAFWIAFFYLISSFLFQIENLFENVYAIGLFIFFGLLFSFLDESVSTKIGRWEYEKTMPMMLGVGLTPFLEVALTGTIALLILSI